MVVVLPASMCAMMPMLRNLAQIELAWRPWQLIDYSATEDTEKHRIRQYKAY